MKCFLDSKALFGLSSTTILLRALRGRVQGFLSRLESDLPREQRENVGLAFRELLNNAIEWGGRLDPNQRVRISFVRTPRALLYHIDDPGPGFRLEELKHAAINNPEDDPLATLRRARRKGSAPAAPVS
jgi:anti-sigma regulatory factor (Ser/Thr protein kinase)